MTLVGQQIGRYRILEELGTGGMSVVYKGLDTALDREVAIKVLHPHLAGKKDARQRLAQEARAVAKLHHPNILEVFDVSVVEGSDAFLVTEYIRGTTLKEFADREPLHPPELAAMVIHELAAALAHAHAAGVIHRDIKPENVMVREDGRLKLMDFGIAKLLDRDERMTQTGALVGSPAHMAPEIIEGMAASAASDVFSLGTMLYWLATGSLPFTAPNTTATLKRILDGAYEDPKTRSRAVSDELASILARCLERAPEARYPDATGLQEALAAYLGSLGLSRPSEELSAFFASPERYRTELSQRLVEHWMAEAERLLRAKRPAKALGRLDQVLALSPAHGRALKLVSDTNRRRKRRRRVRRSLAALSALALLSLALWWGARARSTVRSVQPGGGLSGELGAKPRDDATPPRTHRSAAVSAEPSRPPRPSGARSAPEPAHRSAAAPSGAATAEVEIQVLVRPYGYVQIDHGPRTAEPLAQHALKATPGKHRVTVSCEYCETSTETIDVKAGGENVFPLPAQLKPSRVSFAYEPAHATVRVGDEERTVERSRLEPFTVRVPPGPVRFQNPVEYEVSAPGFRTERKRALLVPGRTTVLSGQLAPE